MKGIKIVFKDSTQDKLKGTILFEEGKLTYYSINSETSITREIKDLYYIDTEPLN